MVGKPKGGNRKETGAETPHWSKKGGGHFSKKKISTSSTLESKREFLSKNFKVFLISGQTKCKLQATNVFPQETNTA